MANILLHYRIPSDCPGTGDGNHVIIAFRRRTVYYDPYPLVISSLCQRHHRGWSPIIANHKLGWLFNNFAASE